MRAACVACCTAVADLPAAARAWLEQAEADLRAAEDSAAAGHPEWSCFQAQQAGEKALKALLFARGRTSIRTHSLRRLVRASVADDIAVGDLDDDARLLDQHYILTRYPNGLDEEMAPAAYYEPKDATACLRSARSILERVTRICAS